MTHTEKKKILERLLVIPDKNKRGFWAKEMKCFGELLKLYPNTAFWIKIKFAEKFESINLLRSGYFADELKNKYSRYLYKIPSKPKIHLSDKPIEKVQINTTPKTLKDFLN